MSQTDPIAGEDEIIDLLRPLASEPGAFWLRDDCAALTPRPGMDLVLKTDPVAERVHFLPDDTPEDVAWKALAVNVSDLAAKAARPRAYLMALSFPTPPSRAWLTRFARGLGDAQRAFGCSLLGGDTDRRPGPVTVSVTVIGEVPTGRMVRRATAAEADVLFATGTIGDAHLGLRLCREPGLASALGLDTADVEQLQARYRRPQPRLGLAPALLGHASAAMDVSDGLIKDATRMARGSGVSAQVFLEKIPLSKSARKAIARDPGLLARLVTAGDDYEVLAAVPHGKAAAFVAEAAACAVPVTEIGLLVRQQATPVSVLDAQGRTVTMAQAGWDHF